MGTESQCQCIVCEYPGHLVGQKRMVSRREEQRTFVSLTIEVTPPTAEVTAGVPIIMLSPRELGLFSRNEGNTNR